MCGICGFYGFKDDKLIIDMLNSIVHRGPDDYGIYRENNIALGHRRLSIIDLKKGKQPIFNENKNIVIVYNGEIYNYKELRNELEKKGHRFYTNTDTEVIVHAYEEYGKKCLEKFDGMFAFALWDSVKKILFLARDRMGMKPLYYYKKGKKFLFASEIKAILEYSKIKPKPEPKAICDYFTYHYIFGDKTYFKGIKLLQPAHYIIISDGSFKIEKYWDLCYKPQNQKDVVKKFYRTLRKAVKRHLISDVPVGSTLSGGFDSSSISVIASEMVKKKLSVFTIGFKEGGRYDERPLARKVSNDINVRVFEKTINPETFKTLGKKMIYFLDDPRNGSPTFSQYHLAELISKHVKVVLTGHGGDELFAGYHVFKAFYFLDQIKKNPFKIFKLFRLFKTHELLRGLYFIFFPIFDSEVRKTGLFVVFSRRERKKIFTKEFYSLIKNYKPEKIKEVPQNSSFTERALHTYLKIYLPTLLLVQDKMGMAFSVEARIPLCDNKILELSLKIPMREKLKNNQLKYIIKEAMKSKLPKALYNAPKKGFPTPFALWFSKELKKYIYNLLLNGSCVKKKIFNKKYVKKLLDKYCYLKKDTPLSLIGVNKIWCLLTTELWFRIFIDGEKDLIKKENFDRYKKQIIKI